MVVLTSLVFPILGTTATAYGQTLNQFCGNRFGITVTQNRVWEAQFRTFRPAKTALMPASTCVSVAGAIAIHC